MFGTVCHFHEVVLPESTDSKDSWEAVSGLPTIVSPEVVSVVKFETVEVLAR
jgi:hypothetical protein